MIGERIKHARLTSGLTLNQVAELLTQVGHPITAAALSKYEHNKSAPKATVLLKLAPALGVKPSYFLTEPDVRVTWLAFRKGATLRPRRQMQIKAVALDVAEGQHWLQSLLYPDMRIDLPPRRPIRTFDDAEAAAQELRATWHLGLAPIESVTQTIEDHGGIVVGWDQDHGEFDGLSAWINGSSPLLVMNTTVPVDRRRFSLAHELDHLLDERSEPPSDHEEKLAHRFAGAFLVPAEVARQELGSRRRHLSLEELGLLKMKYGLSMQAWAHRALDLDIIDRGLYNSLRAEFVKRDSVIHEPVAYEASEEPLRLRQMTLHALVEGIITEERARDLCPDCVASQPLVRPEGRTYTARELMRLPLEERNRILAEQAEQAAEEYHTNHNLTDFEAFGEDDLYDDYPE